MLTIRVIHIGDGFEKVKEVDSVHFVPPVFDGKGKLLDEAMLFAFYPKDEPETIREAVVYVMNEGGKTIAKYEMNKPPFVDRDSNSTK